MNTATRVGAFGAGLVVAFGAALGAGRLVGPLDAVAAPAPHTEMSTDGHVTDPGGHATEGDQHADTHQDSGAGASATPAGLSSTDQGYRLVPGATTLAASKAARVTFQVLGPDGRPVTGFTTAHEKKLHLVVVRRDLSGFQHVHPTMAADGTWSVSLDLGRPGQWRMFADFDPESDTEGLVLGTDLAVPGDYSPVALPAPARTTMADRYAVQLTGSLDPATPQRLDLAVADDSGRPVDLEPYLGADGHLVVLREGDLAYAHAHPVHATTVGDPASGATVGFRVEPPGPGRYRAFLDFKVAGTVHTAAFTLDAAGGTP